MSSYDFEDIEYNHTPTFPCVGDSTVIVYPDPKDAANKTLLVDSAGTAATATYYFTDISEKFEVSVDVYAPALCNWQVGLFPDQFDGRIQFAVTGDANGNLLVTANTVSTYKAGECVTPLTAGTTVTYQWMAVRSSSSAVVSSGLKLGEPITVTAAGTNYTNHTVEFTMPSIAEIGKNARLELVITYDGTASTDKYSSFVDNVVITKYKTEKPKDIEMLQMSSIRGESTNGQGQYISAGIRFRSRVTEDFHNKATEMGFIAVPSEALGDKDIADYTGNLAISAKVMGEGMNEIVYEVSTDDNGSKLYDYQLIITGLTRQGVTENLLDTKITVAMYAVIDGEKIFTESVSYSYADVLATTLKK
ncbi:MAG: hypothetical protein J6Q76_08555 [Clostridia bacterium]|nr:hypothetical protein [Clostridia bacterium]